MTLYFYAPGDTVPSNEPVTLPQNWENVSSLDALEPEDLAALHWKPAVDEIPKFEPLTETCRRVGWTVHKDRVVAKYVVEDKDLATIKREARARVAQKRWEAEIAGIELNGVRIDTSRDAQAKLAGAALLTSSDPLKAIDWKTPDGWVQMDAARILEMAKLVSLHIQACYTRERVINELIDTAESAAAVLRAEAW